MKRLEVQSLNPRNRLREAAVGMNHLVILFVPPQGLGHQTPGFEINLPIYIASHHRPLSNGYPPDGGSQRIGLQKAYIMSGTSLHGLCRRAQREMN